MTVLELDEGTQGAGHAPGPARLAVIAELVLRQVPYRTIATQVGISKSQVHRDVEAIRQAWRERAMDSYEEHVAEQVAMLDMLERVALDALDGQEKIGPRLAAVETVMRLRTTRSRLLGLDRPVRVEATVTTSTPLDDAIAELLAQFPVDAPAG